MSESGTKRWAKRCVLLAVCLVVGIGLTLFLSDVLKPEPHYKGKPVSYWINQTCRWQGVGVTTSKQLDLVKRIGPVAIPFLIAKLQVGQGWPWKMWFTVRSHLPNALRRLFPLPPPGMRQVAANCLAQFGPGAKSAVPALIGILRGTNSRDDNAVAGALVAIGPAAKAALPSLRTALHRQESLGQAPLGQVDLAYALWKLDRDTNSVLSFCRRVMAPPASNLAVANASLLLSQLGPAAAPLTPLLIDLVQDPTCDAGARGNAAGVLGTIGQTNEAVIQALLTGARDTNLNVSVSSARVLWRLEPHLAPVAVPVILHYIAARHRQSPNYTMNLTQFASYTHLRLAAARTELVALSQHASPEIRALAAQALRAIENQAGQKKDAGE